MERYKSKYEINGLTHTNGHKPADNADSEIERLQKENDSLKLELPAMEKAFNQAQDQNMRKIMELLSSEDKIAKLQAEKSKADQKYFAAMKSKDQTMLEMKALKVQNLKQQETCAKYHEVERDLILQVHNLESQLALAEQGLERYKLELSKSSHNAEALQTRMDAASEKAADALKRAEKATESSLEAVQSLRLCEEDAQATKATLSALQEENKRTQSAVVDGDQLQVYRA